MLSNDVLEYVNMFEKYIHNQGFKEFPRSNNRYFINVDGQILNNTGEVIPVTIDEYGLSWVFANLWELS